MRKFTDFNAGSKAVAAGAQTIIFSGNDIPGNRVTAYHLSFPTGANDLADVTRIRVKADGETLWDTTLAAYRTLFERMSRANVAPGLTLARFMIPLYHLDAKGDERYMAQFPKGRTPTVEITLGAGTVAGTLQIGYDVVDADGAHFYKYFGSSMNIATPAVTAVNQPFNVTGSGNLRGYSVNTGGVTRSRLVISGVQQDQGTFLTMRSQDQAENPVTIDDPLFRKIHGAPALLNDGRSQIFFDLDATWGGTGNEITLYTVHAQ